MDLVSRARAEIGKDFKFDIRSDGVNSTNCIQFILKLIGIEEESLPYPKIDALIRSLPKKESPAMNNIIAYPSKTIGRGAWAKLVPGCAAIISEVKDKKVSKIIIAHPRVPGIIGEITPELFDGKPNSFLEVS
jgi:hypothetical protein